MDGGGVRRRRRACARCRVMKKKCRKNCRWAQQFPAREHERFTILHRIFGGKKVMEIIQRAPRDRRADAIASLVYEANARDNDPVNGSLGEVRALRGQLAEMIAEVERLQVLHQADG